MFWVFDGMTDFLNGFLLMTEENKPLDALYSVAFGLHKSPIAYNECKNLQYDLKLFTDFYTIFFTQSIDTWGAELTLICWNTFYNWVDLLYEFIVLEQVYKERIWTSTGEYMAKITSDIFFKSPITKTWNYKNSDVLSDEWSEPPPLWDGIVHEINDVLQYYELDPIPEDVSGVEVRPPPVNNQIFPKVESAHHPSVKAASTDEL